MRTLFDCVAGRAGRRAALAGLLGALVLGVAPVAAQADPLTGFSVTDSSQVAGAHGDVSVQLEFATEPYPADDEPTGEQVYPVALAKRITVDLPPGMLADTAGAGTCAETVVEHSARSCPEDSVVGELEYERATPYGNTGPPNFEPALYETNYAPIINQAPTDGDTAQFAMPFAAGLAVVHIGVKLRDGSDYGAQATISELPSAEPLVQSDVILWGDPSSSGHDGQRLACFETSEEIYLEGCSASEPEGATFMVNPVACSGPSTATASVEYYNEPVTSNASASIPAFTGCESLAFSPSLSFLPEGGAGTVGQPAAFTTSLTVPQEAANDVTASDASANVDDVSVTLPPGVALSPGVANGLGACSDAEFGYGSEEPQSCPLDSQLGTVTVESPLLDSALTGHAYVGAQESSDPASGQMYRLFLDATGQGLDVKLVGSISANPSTGQLTATFPQNPQAPFSSLQLSLKGGPSAPLSNPQACGTATTSWSISSYVSPASPVTGSSSYQVSGDCAESSQFTPTLSAGSQGLQAGSSSPFVFTIARPDGQQEISGVSQVTLPLGLSAAIRGVTQCASAAAAAGACPASSQIGTATVEAGSGTEPFVLQNQPIYLTGPYEGAPFGLAVKVEAIAGPFDLGTVVVRQAVYVNPTTAQLTVKSDALPTILGGVPLDLRAISLDIDRPEFMREPTSCEAESLSATLTSAPLGQAANVIDEDVGYAASTASTASLSEPYQVQGCASLPFKPSFSASTKADHTRKDGSSLGVKIATSPGEANIAKIHVELPKKLPSELRTLNLACTEAQFAANPAGCPKESMVGYAVAHTPDLSVPLQGPAIFVSHGGAGFPNLDLVLQGEGVTIVLVGDTFIDEKSGITTSTFATVPDVPVSQFELSLPAQAYSALGGNGSFCEAPLYMPTSITGQNGAVIEQKTKIAVSGCKPEVRVVKKKVKGSTARILVRVPSAGKLVATGKGIATAKLSAGGAKVVTIAVHLAARQRRAAAKRGQRVRVKVELRFAPKHGKALVAHTRLLLR